ncbi:FecR family protein [Agaribacterium haliotis]|uniref:FecR family protein n=1 Tax=Agaribacterium haliotis TaxID=2013869 RepID=UPI000BB5367A|nr:FecR family protein [Agaribacterium haliotis]
MEQQKPTASPSDQLLLEATEWMAKLEASDCSATDQRAFLNWVNTSDEHRQAYQEVKEVWEFTSALEHVDGIELDEPQIDRLDKRKSAWSSHGLSFAGIAASLLLATCIVLFHFTASEQPAKQSYISAVGQIEEVLLADGSRLTLSTNTRVDVSYSDSKRELSLVKGEAYFDVAKDKQRPFVVNTGNGEVRAVGTAFNINRELSRTVVTITEGIVAIEKNGMQAVEVEADYSAVIGRGQLPLVRLADEERELAWMQQQLVYRDTPLREVLNGLNRYLHQPVKLEDSSLAGIRVNGTLDVSDPQQALEVLLDSYELTTLYNGGTRVVAKL